MLREHAESCVPMDYRRLIRRKQAVIWGLTGLLLLIMGISLVSGSSGLSLHQLFETLLGRGGKQSEAILFHVRLPRAATAAVVGAALALSGCVMQNVLRNPLASASTLGVSQGASFGAAAAILWMDTGLRSGMNTTGASDGWIALFAFLGGSSTTVLILVLSRIHASQPSLMVLTGVALSSLFTGATTILQYFADDVQVSTMVYWTFGDLSKPGWKEIGVTALCAIAGMIYFLWNRWNYNALEAGTHTARSLGVKVPLVTCVSMGVCTLIAAVSVAFVGIISFVGLIAPHMVRKLVGSDHRFLIPASALWGASLLLLADIVSRSVLSPTVLPIGAITSFLGAPLFLYLVLKGRKRI